MEPAGVIEKDGRLYLVLMPTRSASLKECIVQNRIQDIGKIQPKRTLVNLNADRKRLWLGTLKSIADGLCNDSLSLSLNHFSKDGFSSCFITSDSISNDDVEFCFDLGSFKDTLQRVSFCLRSGAR